MRTINPATRAPIRDWQEHDRAEVERRLDAAARAYAEWRQVPFARRAELMRALAGGLRGGKDAHARLMTEEMGKPIGEAAAEVEKCAWVCEHYAEHAAALLAPEPVATEARRSLIRYEPLGAVLAIMPWNFPCWQLFRFASASVMAGNVVLLKHAPNVWGCAEAIEELFRAAGFPPAVLTNLRIDVPAVEPVIADPRVVGVTLTGSVRAGQQVASLAGRHLKKCVLELGGSDPFVVLADADPEAAAIQAAKARCINSGQSCIAAKRFIVEEPVADAFEAALVRRFESLRVGDPTDPHTDIGPMAREDLLEQLEDQVTRSLAQGAALRAGGRRLDGPGWFYAPTVLTGVRPGMTAFEEETFGPVAAVTRATDTDEAIALANRSVYGLGASLWTGDPDRGEALAARIEAGCVFVNGMVKSDPRLPFGGIKESGYGRELGRPGLLEFVNVKSVWVS